MKKFLLTLSLFAMSMVVIAQTQVSISGPSTVSCNQSANYSAAIPSGGTNVWSVSGGTINGQTYIVTNSSAVTVQWGSTPGTNKYISLSRFNSWPPTGSPTHYGSRSVTIQCNSNPSNPAPGTCQWFQLMITNTYNSVSDPSQRCIAIMATYNGILQSYPDLSSCTINLYGCN
jgi:hypothetical protein